MDLVPIFFIQTLSNTNQKIKIPFCESFSSYGAKMMINHTGVTKIFVKATFKDSVLRIMNYIEKNVLKHKYFTIS